MSEFRDDPTGQVKQARDPQSRHAAEISNQLPADYGS